MGFDGHILFTLVFIHVTYVTTFSDKISPNVNEVRRNNDDIVHPLTLERQNGARYKRDVVCPELECRSLCPWTWVHDSQEGREPRSIFRAQCMNQTCHFDISGIGHKIRRKLQLQTECELVYTDIEVWLNGEPNWIRWPIACACSRTRSRIMMRLGEEIVMSEFNRFPSSGVRAIDESPDNTVDIQLSSQDPDIPLQQRRRHSDNSWK